MQEGLQSTHSAGMYFSSTKESSLLSIQVQGILVVDLALAHSVEYKALMNQLS